jgi:L-histidine Nalpha-methyltransferase
VQNGSLWESGLSKTFYNAKGYMGNIVLNKTKDKIFPHVLRGLLLPQKKLPSKLFYDEKGSLLFDKICELDEYYLTRTEIKILKDNIDEIASCIGSNILLFELGSGNNVKTRILLEQLENITLYVPIDISVDYLVRSASMLKFEYPNIPIFPLYEDYTKDFELPIIEIKYNRRICFFPGSTLGNFTPDYAKEFLRRISKICGKNGGLLIGLDLKKDTEVLEAAYNDSKGATAEFNLNILERINNEFHANFKLDKFEHNAIYNEKEGRIEMYLRSKAEQLVKINDLTINLDAGENILTEYSYKYNFDTFKNMVSDFFKIEKVWTDNNQLFSVQYLTVK